MAQSMFDIIETGKIEVNHNGNDVWFTVPEVLTSASGCLEDEVKMLEWIKKVGVLNVGHSAISDMIIDLRAEIRPNDIKDSTGKKVKASLVKDEVFAQKRADNWLPKAKTRPGTGGKTPEQRQAEALKILAGLTTAQIAEVLMKAQR
jgi:hypothetical protein